MKHNSTTSANGLHTPPCGSSQSKSTRFSLLTSLLLFFLLFVGSNAAWARPTIYGEGLPGLNASGAANWDNNTKEMSAYGEANTYYAEFLNVAATDNNTYRFKIAVNDAGDWWSGSMDSNNTNESMGNVDIVSANETQISFKMPFAGDVYVFYKSSNANDSKVWIVAVPQVSAIGNTTAQSKTMMFDLLIKNNGWNSSINFIKNNVDALTYKYVTSYVAPACTSDELASSKAPRVRYEAYSGSDKYSGKSSPHSAELTTSVRRVIYLWDGNKNNAPQKYLIPTYPNRSNESGWKLWAYDGSNNISGDLSNGSVTVQISGGKEVKYFITNSTSVTGPNTSNFTDNTRHSVNSFGGCYVDEANSSNVTFGTKYQIYNSNDGGVYKIGNIAKPIVAENDMRGLVTIDGSGTKDVTFSFDGGKIVISAVDHGAAPDPEPSPSGVTYDGSEYIYYAKQNSTSIGDWNYWNNDCAMFMEFSDGSTNRRSPRVAFFWDSEGTGGNVLAAQVPEGTWTKCRLLRTRNEERGTVWNTSDWYNLDESKNYLASGATWSTHSPRTFHFYISGSAALANTGSDFNAWNGNGDAHSGNMTKTLNAGTYKFKLNPTGTVDWRSEFNMDDVDQSNSNVTLYDGNNKEIWFAISRKSDVTIACDGSKVTVNATPYYNVTFNSDGGSDVASQSVLSGGTASQPSDPTKAGGYTFNGWKLNDAAYNFSTAVTSDITLVADWTAPTLHTVTFNTDGGSTIDPVQVADGNAVAQPSNPTKSGYNFVKWQLSGVDYNFENAVTADIELVAVWNAKTLTGISLDQTNVVMVLGGDAVTLTPSYEPADLIPDQQPTYDWSVSPSGIVTVENGVITAVAEGTATVTCTAHGTDKSADCVVTVKDCNTEPTDILSYTLGSDPTGIAAGSAAMNGMFDEASQSEPAMLTKVRLALGNNDDYKYVYDPNTGVGAQLKYGDNNTDYAYWYRIEAGKTGSNIQIYVLKNVGTGKYLAKAAGGGNGNWDWVQAITASSADANTAKWHLATSTGQRLMNLDKSDGNGSYSTREYFLHRYNVNGSGTTSNQTVVVGSSDGDQGNGELKFNFRDESNVANPNYLHSPVDGYYRFTTGANVEVTLNRAIKVNDVIRLEVKNPSDAAVSATITIGSQVANINLAAGATSTETITVTDASRPTSITIASNDVNFMLKSVAVNREMPNPAKNPNLAWSATPSAAHQVADGDISSYIATRLGTGLITYTSSDESIATIAANGTVHPIAEGTVTITATLEQDGCYDGGSINYSLTLVDLPKPTITITANDEMPQGSYQTVTVAQNGDGALTFEITSGTGATLTDNGDGTYRLALVGNATDIVLTASTERTEEYAQHSVTKNIGVQQCYVDGHVIYEYELTGHADATGVAATGGTYSQSNIGSEGTADNPNNVNKVRLALGNNDDYKYVYDPNTSVGAQLKYGDNNTDYAYWYQIAAGRTGSDIQIYILKNVGTGNYLAKAAGGGNGNWDWVQAITASSADANTAKWHLATSTGQRLMNLDKSDGNGSYSTREYFLHRYNVNGSGTTSNQTVVVGSSDGDQGNGELKFNFRDATSAANPDYFYSVTHDAHEYYILNGGTVTISRASAFKAGDVITLNVFNRGNAADNTIKVANNTIATNVNGAAALEYTVAASDGIQGETSFVITPLNGYICLNSISIFRPKDEDEFINPVLTWDADLSAQQLIDRNASESSMQHAASFVAPVNASVVYSVAPAAKATVNEAGLVTLTAEAVNKDVVTVTATLPAIGCYNEATTSYEIYVKDLAEPTLSVAFADGLKQGYAATLTVETNSDATPVLSAATGFTYGDAEHVGNVYTYPIVISGIAESVSVHVALAQTLDFLAKEADAASDEIAVSNLQDLYDNTPAEGTLELQSNYDGQELIIDKEITINGNGHAIGNLTVETAGDLTLSGALTVNDFSIYAKAGNSEHQAESGQVRNASGYLTANGNAYFYYTVDPGGHIQHVWYDFTVPFPVDVMTGVKGIQNELLKENFVNETDYAIMEFLGDNKAEGKYAYKKFRGVMQPNHLYSITLDDEYNYNLIRFQKTNSGALVADESMALPAHEGAEATKNNWNGVGNGTLHHVNIGGVGATTIQVYQSGDKSFMPVTISEKSFAIGTAFMIQGTETMVFSQANHDLLAPRRAAEVQPMTVQIAREGKPFSDQLFIRADELAGQGYTQGVDVAKAGDLGSAKVAQIWVNAYNSKLCAHEAQLINGRAKYALSLYAPADGTYTLTGMNIPEGSTLYLTKNNKVIWNLGYTCDLDLTQGTTTEYGLLLVQSPQISTGVDNIHSDANDTKKIMHNGILYILHNGKVFNAQGACVE